MPTVSKTAADQPRATARIDLVTEITCCGSWRADLSATADVSAESGGRELAKAVCDVCGSEYMFGVIARTREASLASEAFEHVNDETLDEIGVDRSDFEPSMEDVAMCVGCDGAVNRNADYCGGCKEYVCATCRKRMPRTMSRHAAEDHWQEPKFRGVETKPASTDGDDDDDGSRLDFTAEE